MASIAEEIAAEDQQRGTPPGPQPGADQGAAATDEDDRPAGGSGLLGGVGGWLRGVLRRPTGPGELDGYLAHPANVSGDRDGARIARGLEGLTDGAFGLAVVDLALGAWGLLKRKGTPPTPPPTEGGKAA